MSLPRDTFIRNGLEREVVANVSHRMSLSAYLIDVIVISGY
jgi:hypothetical protein